VQLVVSTQFVRAVDPMELRVTTRISLLSDNYISREEKNKGQKRKVPNGSHSCLPPHWLPLVSDEYECLLQDMDMALGGGIADWFWSARYSSLSKLGRQQQQQSVEPVHFD
jgi:hypothetical protein